MLYANIDHTYFDINHDLIFYSCNRNMLLTNVTCVHKDAFASLTNLKNMSVSR